LTLKQARLHRTSCGAPRPRQSHAVPSIRIPSCCPAVSGFPCRRFSLSADEFSRLCRHWHPRHLDDVCCTDRRARCRYRVQRSKFYRSHQRSWSRHHAIVDPRHDGAFCDIRRPRWRGTGRCCRRWPCVWRLIKIATPFIGPRRPKIEHRHGRNNGCVFCVWCKRLFCFIASKGETSC
jgi:hypothetical protein